MKTISKIRAAFVVLGLLSVLRPTATGQDASARIKSQLKTMQIELTAFEKQATQQNWDAAPAAVRALAEKATGQTLNLLEGAHGFAILTDVEKGALSENYASALYYAGESRASAQFNAFCYTLDLPRKPAAFPLRSISPELQQLQTRVMAAYRPPRSVKHHADFIRLNATLKLAGELDAAKLYAGALYQYLDATQQFALLDAAAPAAGEQSRLRKSLQKMSIYLSGSQQDQSIAQLFLERAEAGLTRSPGAAGWIAVETVVEQVLARLLRGVESIPAFRASSAGWSYRDAGPLALHLKLVRPSKFADSGSRGEIPGKG